METRTPAEEMGKRAAEAGAGMAAAGKAAGLLHHVDGLAAYRKRVADAHANGQAALGMPASSGPEDEMGSKILVTGDVYGDEAVKVLQAANGQQAQPETPSLLSKALPYVLAAAIGVGGGGLGALALTGNESQPAVEQASSIDTDTQYELRLGQ